MPASSTRRPLSATLATNIVYLIQFPQERLVCYSFEGMAVDKVGVEVRSPGFPLRQPVLRSGSATEGGGFGGQVSPPGIEKFSVSMVGRERGAGRTAPAKTGTPYFVHGHDGGMVE